MPVSRALRRLLRIRNIEEEQHRLTLESAAGEFRLVEDALNASHRRERSGSELHQAGLRSGDVVDAQSGHVEQDVSRISTAFLEQQRAASELRVAALREALREKQIQYRQTEALIDNTIEADAIDSARHTQNHIDDWFRSRLFSERRIRLTTEGENEARSDCTLGSTGPDVPKERSH